MRIDIEEKKMEIRRVELQVDELELTILKRLHEIEGIKKNIGSHKDRAVELKKQLAAMQGG